MGKDVGYGNGEVNLPRTVSWAPAENFSKNWMKAKTFY